MKMPELIEPMLATLVDKPFNNADWIYEVKWDRYRALAYLNEGGADIKSRNKKSFNEKFYPLHQALTEWQINAVIDGEIVAVNEEGVPDFSALQNWRSEADGALLYYVFDLLWLHGKSLLQKPLIERRKNLEDIIPALPSIKLSESFNADARDFFDAAKKLNLEGIMAKQKDSLYYPGKHSKEWLKIKTEKSQEVVIGGFTRNEGSSKLFSSLLVGLPAKSPTEK